MLLEDVKSVFFVGVGGIGMSALARYFKVKGYNVGGYDRTETVLTKKLLEEGISVIYKDNVNRIDEQFKNTKTTLVIYTPAIPFTNNIFSYYAENFNIYKRSQVLGMIAKEYNLVGVAGTHGKTTVSTMIAHLFRESSLGCCAFIGGIAKNFGSNMIISEDTNWCVMEADEFDRSFLQLYPEISIITSMDADHLDIYGDVEELNRTFNKYALQTNAEGIVIYKKGLKLELGDIRSYTYSLNDSGADFFASGIKIIDGAYSFCINTPDGMYSDFRINYPGKTNLENAIVSIAAAIIGGVTIEEIRSSIFSFEGVVRRFDVHYKDEDFVYIDDYAHHPKELKSTILSVRDLYPDKKIIGVFQPHLYTRTRDFAQEFTKSLNLLDELILLDIYPAREKPIEGIDSSILLNGITIPSTLCSREELTGLLRYIRDGVLLTLGAGDIDKFVPELTYMFKNR